MRIKLNRIAVALTLVSVTQLSLAASIVVPVSGANGKSYGAVSFEDSSYGLLIKPKLSGLPAGQHGFHLHQYPDCSEEGMKAGGHYDPAGTNSHQGPYGAGHLGDLPVLAVDDNGVAAIPVLAPRLKTSDIEGLALMIHAGGDNYSDNPPMGGGGARIGCGVIAGGAKVAR